MLNARTNSVINTVQRTVAEYLDEYNYNSPEVSQAFEKMIDWVFSQISSGVTIAALSIGNEADILLESACDGGDYTGSFQAAEIVSNQ